MKSILSCLLICLIFCIVSIESQLERCDNLDANLVKCNYNTSCVYGELNTVDCHIDDNVTCIDHSFPVTFQCVYCWQLDDSLYSCLTNNTCKANSRYLTTCKANSTVHCLGNREFKRYKHCNIDNGHKWSIAVSLSVLFGGFGIDRFYMGHWQEGVGKLFSFGGFGVWTLIDAILITIGYLKPADATQYRDD